MVVLDYRDARPIYIQICDGVREQILTGILQQGDKLPSVRDMATQLTINPNTIQRAYRQLEMEGWIASVAGKGSFVCGVPVSAGLEQRPLWDALDTAVSRLTAAGVDTQEIIRRISGGGNENA
ncbi:MAG: GntR family transcriptional regulator [Firmicutes bacterium]|nr:GntR family transcriptional regulator [Bacillota bacterium]